MCFIFRTSSYFFASTSFFREGFKGDSRRGIATLRERFANARAYFQVGEEKRSSDSSSPLNKAIARLRVNKLQRAIALPSQTSDHLFWVIRLLAFIRFSILKFICFISAVDRAIKDLCNLVYCNIFVSYTAIYLSWKSNSSLFPSVNWE